LEELALVVDLVLAVFAAFVGGVIAQRLGQPVIVGYLLAGVAIGPFTPGPSADVHNVAVVAEIGVAFLMFALGAEFSLGELRRLGRVAAIGGALQILGTVALGPALAPLLGLTLAQGVFVGALLSLSSTVVALKVLMARGELQAMHGRIALGLLIAQDIAVVPMVVLLPSLTLGGEGLLQEIAVAAGKALLVLLGAYVLGAKVVPRALAWAAVQRSRELFLLGVVAFALGTALVTQWAGLSLAFGAFLAGVVLSESDFRTQVVAEVLPLRDLFASLFFVSVGMLVDPNAVTVNAAEIALLSAVVVLGKSTIATLAILALGMPGRAALLSGLALAQVGEFSFVLARVGIQAGAIPQRVLDQILATAVVTIVLTPFALRAAPRLAEALASLPGLGKRFVAPAIESTMEPGARGHAVICGFGRVARELADALEARRLRYLIIEYNPQIVRELRARGVPVIYGDAANPAVLEHAHLEGARLLAVLTPDPVTAELVTRHARAAHPRLDIVARASDQASVDRINRAGATEVVQPEFEAGIEVIHHTLQRFGVAGPELVHATAGRRAAFYRRGGVESS
jgi:CPA2 family monovalent cation:H+ antiporter-2